MHSVSMAQHLCFHSLNCFFKPRLTDIESQSVSPIQTLTNQLRRLDIRNIQLRCGFGRL